MATKHRFDNHTNFTLLRDRDGITGTIKALPEKEYDREDIGQRIFVFTPEDGSEAFHAFEDELTPRP